MAITWRNINAPDLSGAAQIMQQGATNIQNSLGALQGMAEAKVAADTEANTVAAMENIRRNVTDLDTYENYDFNQLAQRYGNYMDQGKAMEMLLGMRGDLQTQENTLIDQDMAERELAFRKTQGQAEQDRWKQNRLMELAGMETEAAMAQVSHDYNLIKEAYPIPPEFEPDSDPNARTNARRDLENQFKAVDGEWLTFGEYSGQDLMKRMDKQIADLDKEFKAKYGTPAPAALVKRIMTELPKTDDGNVYIKQFPEIKNRIMELYAPDPANYKMRSKAKAGLNKRQRELTSGYHKAYRNIIGG